MSEGYPLIIHDSNLSIAWAKAFSAVYQSPGAELSQVMTVIDEVNQPVTEDSYIRNYLDNTLQATGFLGCASVASTIFPISLWNRDEPAAALYDRYNDLLPSIKDMDPRNRYGLYFERLIAFGDNKVNQLDHIIQTRLRGNNRRSALQASVFDPNKDHTHQRRRGFPCLQHIVVSPDNHGGLSIVGFYATQHYLERAYGNFLGLSHLGEFLAHEMRLQLRRVTCIANLALLGNTSKRDVQHLYSTVSERLTQIA